jgi:U3 small nucleolar RNA-associated protein 22
MHRLCLHLQHGWRPVEEVVQSLREKFGSLALFFFNELAPEVIGVLWRPTSFMPQPFSVMRSEYVRPVDDAKWQSDSMVVHNARDIFREISEYTDGVIANVKVLDDRSIKPRLKKRSAPESSDDSSSESE